MSANEVINETAAEWWAERFGIPEKRAEFKAALLKHLPASGPWFTYNDYDPSTGPLLDAVREVTCCRGFMFSGSMLPGKTGLRLHLDGRLLVKEGYGTGWTEFGERGDAERAARDKPEDVG